MPICIGIGATGVAIMFKSWEQKIFSLLNHFIAMFYFYRFKKERNCGGYNSIIT
jgi:hypothetical protein